MAVIAKFVYEVVPGKMHEFMEKLAKASHPKFSSPVMPKSMRMFKSTVPGPDNSQVILMLEYADMAAYGARTAFENSHPDWRRIFASRPDSPEKLVSVELLTEFTAGDAV